MEITKKSPDSQFIIFIFCIMIFIGAAIFGWNKLQYGFNFMDEGYHMTESWRLAAGDDFLKDKITGALLHYTLINSLIFKIYPDITLIDFRKIQYILTICSLLIFGLAIFKVSGQYAWLPFIFSLFAFTGLDPIGMISNLYYQTYPHLFLTLFLSFLLLGLHIKKSPLKETFFLLSGFCLWLISLSLLYLSVIVFAPVLIFFLVHKFNLKSYPFTLKELSYVLAPFVLSWITFIVIYNKPYLMNIRSSLHVALSMPSHSLGSIHINWEVIKHIIISIVFLLGFFFIMKKMPLHFVIIGCTFLSISIFFIITTSFGGLLAPYYYGWFGKPMWFSSLLIVFTTLFWIYMISKYCIRKEINREEELSIILMVPFTICSLTMTTFSSLGALSASQSAIPAVASIPFLFKYKSTGKKKYSNQTISTLMAILLLAPFYYTTARSDWDFTFFDVSPKYADIKIEKGFGKGIYTNKIYYNMYKWLSYYAEKYTKKNDYIISYVVSPMVHMITKRRPSLDDTFVIFEKPEEYYKKSVELMKKRGRTPQMAFVFESWPFFFPNSFKPGTYTWSPKCFDFQSSQDPISSYVKSNMKQISEFKISDDHIIRCFIDNKLEFRRCEVDPKSRTIFP